MQNNLYKNDFDGKLFAERLREFAGAKKDCEIAKELGFSTSDISKIFNGKGGLTLDKLFHISNTYNCSIDYLLGITDNNTNQKEYKYPKILDVLLFLLKSNAINIHGNFEYAENVTYEEGFSGLEPISTKEQSHLHIDIIDPIINYLLSEIGNMYSMVQTGQIKEDNFTSWLHGLFSEFDYNVLPRYFTQAQQYSGTTQPESIDYYDSFIERVTEMIGFCNDSEKTAFISAGNSYCKGMDRALKEIEQSTSKKDKSHWEKEYIKALEDEINKDNQGERYTVQMVQDLDPEERSAIKEIEKADREAHKKNKKK